MISQSPWQTNTYTYGDSNWGDLLTAYNSEAITYDTIGNPLTYRDGITMTWQNGRELATLTKGGKTLNFTYDLNGMRTKKTITPSTGSTTNVEYVYENGLLMQMKYGSYVLTFYYDATGTPIGFRAKTTGLDKYYYYGLNSRGDVIALYNADGTLHVTYEYDSFGKLLGVKAADGTSITATYAIATLNPLRYRSYVYDNETGLYYLQSRYYDPETCRFINADAIVATTSGLNEMNLFAYCSNNPIMYSDPSGFCPVYIPSCPECNPELAALHAERGADWATYRNVTKEVKDALLEEADVACIIANETVQKNIFSQVAVLYWFKTRVDHNAPWDIKRKDSWDLTIGTPYPGSSDTKVVYSSHVMTLEALGNYTYGYLGRAYGISLNVLLLGSYYAAGFPNEGEVLYNEVYVDWNYIKMGYDMQ